MTQISDRTVLFADLRGSTAMYETLGNAEATAVVTQTIGVMCRAVPAHGGRVVKTLGDGLMAVFTSPAAGLEAAEDMHDNLELLVVRGALSQPTRSSGLRALKLQIGMAYGEVVEMDGDCFGDAVNVAARLLGHASDNETLATASVLAGLGIAQRARFRSLDWMQLRGRSEPVHVHVLASRRGPDLAVTQFGPMAMMHAPQSLSLAWGIKHGVFHSYDLPVVIGRSPDVAVCVDDSRVSRSHARIDRHGGTYQLTDLSSNGTYVRFGNAGDVIALRRGSCTLHGVGLIALGGLPTEATVPIVHFEIHGSDGDEI
jgi:class 3 adenylate cyclase